MVASARSVAPRRGRRDRANARRADCAGAVPEDGVPPVYSDLVLAAGAAMEARARADELVRREVLAPLGLDARVGSARQLLADPRRARARPRRR
ncbi:MAG: hypothetical protein U0414_23265 [Polyangiaceae bacterium]